MMIRAFRLLALAFAISVADVSLASEPALSYPVTCSDGSTSQSGGKQGACSHHGGEAGGPVSAGGSTTPIADTAPPTITVLSGFGVPAPVKVGIADPAVTLSVIDYGGFAASPSVHVAWGDGSSSDTPFSPVGGLVGSVTIPGHVYGVAGTYTAIVTLVDAAGNQATADLQPVTVLAPPINLRRPALFGTPRSGRTMHCSAGAWRGADTVSWSWLANGHVISDATGTTFLLRALDVRRRVACRVSATNAAGKTFAVSRTLLVAHARHRS